MRLAYPSMNPAGAIATAGNIDVKRSAEISGINTDPVDWTQCASIQGRDTFAIDYAPGQTVSIQKPQQVINGIHPDAAAADSNSYVRDETESWASLASNADITLSGGSFSSSPYETATTCTYANSSNWGEPSRGNGAILGGKDYFPIVSPNSSLDLHHGRGQRILLVNGDVRLNGNF